jgi:cytochrome c oxidase subunit 2
MPVTLGSTVAKVPLQRSSFARFLSGLAFLPVLLVALAAQSVPVFAQDTAGADAAIQSAPSTPPKPAFNMSIFKTASSSAKSIKDVTLFVTAICAGIFILVEGALLYCIIRFRQRPNDLDEPPQLYGSKPVELAWTIAPALTIFVLFMIVLRSILETRKHDPPENAYKVNVIGHQWWWEYEYPEGFLTANELHLPLSEDGKPRPVWLNLQSADVIHSFWVPRLAGKTDVIPNRTNFMWFAPEGEGLYYGQCAEYCGTQHANMLLRVFVDKPEDFDVWLENQAKPGIKDPAVAEGYRLFHSLACLNCHTIRGTDAVGKFGPDLTHFGSRKTIGSGIVENTHEELVKWIYDAQAIKPGCLMPSLHITEAQAEEIARYLESLR